MWCEGILLRVLIIIFYIKFLLQFIATERNGPVLKANHFKMLNEYDTQDLFMVIITSVY